MPILVLNIFKNSKNNKNWLVGVLWNEKNKNWNTSNFTWIALDESQFNNYFRLSLDTPQVLQVTVNGVNASGYATFSLDE